MKTLFKLVLLLTLFAGLAVWAGLRSFRAFLHEDLVAIIRVEPAPPAATYRYRIEVIQMEGETPVRQEKFPMQGDQWSVGGDILKWKPLLVFFGAKSLHHLNRLSSRYEYAKDEATGPRSAYDLNGGPSRIWRGLHQWGINLPFVDAVYGNAVYVPARPGKQWGVYVTHSGYLVRPLRRPLV